MLRSFSAAEELSVSVHDLQAPKEDRALLAYPSLEQAGRLLEENRRRLEACRLEILGRPLQSLRSLARQTVLNLAQEYMAAAGHATSITHDKPLFLAGHQP